MSRTVNSLAFVSLFLFFVPLCSAAELRVSLSGTQRGFLMGKSVVVKATFVNMEDRELKGPKMSVFMKGLHLACPGKEIQKAKVKKAVEGWDSFHLKPGQKRTETVDLTGVFSFNKEGKYVLAYGKDPWEDEKAVIYIVKEYRAVIKTSMGEMSFTFAPEKAPKTVLNFVTLAKKGFYNNLTFHRIINGFMIQGGCPLGDGTGDAGYMLEEEFNDLKHVEGTISMARAQDPNSASCQFFICLGRHPHLDGNYTGFGSLEKGRDVLFAIGAVETTGSDGSPPNRPLKPVVIKSIDVIDVKEAQKEAQKGIEKEKKKGSNQGSKETGGGQQGG